MLIVGVAGLSLAAGITVVARPEWFVPILLLDLWLLGYHHVISTFTRLTLDTESFREHRFLVLGLPWVVLAGTMALGYTVGLWALSTTYLYWQAFHYTRQSYGIVRIYSRKGGNADAYNRLTTWALYLVPLWGLLYRSYQDPPTFLGSEVACLPTPPWVVYLVGVGAVGSMLLWLVKQLQASSEGRLQVALAMYVFSHFVIFVVGYVLIQDINHGWLVINIWHNAQYILIVWMYNNQRFKNGVDSSHWFLSLLSQGNVLNIIAYFSFCLVVTSVVYGLIQYLLDTDSYAAVPLSAMIVYQTINFHHYVVDGLIWKVRKRKLRQTLGVDA